MTRCSRCGDPFELRRVADVHCERCIREVAQLIAADALRRAPRFRQAKDLTGMTGTVL